MTEKPILFSAPMVRALLDGSKTQTHRIVKPQPPEGARTGWYENLATGERLWGWETEFVSAGGEVEYADGTVRPLGVQKCQTVRCPYPVGTHLWVREAWSLPGLFDGAKPSDPCLGPQARGTVRYLADGKRSGRIRASLHMPRWASRLTLEVTGVRVQRVQDLSEQDALAEGIRKFTKDGSLWKFGIEGHWPWQDFCDSAWSAYAKLWDEINGKSYPWASNPWVWAIDLRRVDG